MSRRTRRKTTPAGEAQKAHRRAQAGLDRKEYYENGGESCRYRGLRLVQADKVKKADRRACRGQARRSAVESY